MRYLRQTLLFKYVWNKRDGLYILLITLLGIFYSGYFVTNGDSHLYLTALIHKLKPQLYQNDYVMPGFDALNNFSLYVNLEIWGLKMFGGNLVYALFFYYFIAKYLMFFGVYKISQALFKNRLAGYAAILVTFLPQPLGLTIPTAEVFLLPRMLILGPMLLSLATLLQKKYFLSSLFFAIVFVIHPITASYLVILDFFYFLANKKSWKANIWKMLPMFLLGIMILFFKQKIENSGTMNMPIWNLPESWKEFYRIKERYLFLLSWKWKHWRQLLYATAPLIISFSISKFLPKMNRKNINNILVISLGPLFLFLLNLIFVDLRLTPAILRIEAHRSAIFWFYLGWISFSGMVILMTKEKKSLVVWYLALLTLLALPRLHPAGFIFWLLLWLIFLLIPIKKWRGDLMLMLTIVGICFLAIPYLHQPNWFLWLPIAILMVDYINRKFKSKKVDLIKELAVVLAVLMFATRLGINHIKSNFPADLFYGGIYPNKILWREYLQQKVYFPKLPDIDWFKAQYWARDNTPEQSIFLVPSYTQPGDHTGFRVFSERALAYSSRDGGSVTVDVGDSGNNQMELAYEWIRRYKDLEGNEDFNEEKLKMLREKYKFDYVLRSKSMDPALNFPIAYENFSLRIYQMP